MGDYKLIVGNAGDARMMAWPELSQTPTPFGRDGGVRELGTTHCRAPSGSGKAEHRPCLPHCLFDVVADASESRDLCAGGSCANATHQQAVCQ